MCLTPEERAEAARMWAGFDLWKVTQPAQSHEALVERYFGEVWSSVGATSATSVADRKSTSCAVA